MENLKVMWIFSWIEGLLHNLVSIKPDYDLYNLQFFLEDNIDYLGLKALTLTLFPTSLSAFSPASLLRLFNPSSKVESRRLFET